MAKNTGSLLVRLDYVYNEWKELLKNTSEEKDLNGVKWIKFCLDKSKQHNENEYNKWNIKTWKISSLENARSIIIDPSTDLKWENC